MLRENGRIRGKRSQFEVIIKVKTLSVIAGSCYMTQKQSLFYWLSFELWQSLCRSSRCNRHVRRALRIWFLPLAKFEDQKRQPMVFQTGLISKTFVKSGKNPRLWRITAADWRGRVGDSWHQDERFRFLSVAVRDSQFPNHIHTKSGKFGKCLIWTLCFQGQDNLVFHRHNHSHKAKIVWYEKWSIPVLFIVIWFVKCLKSSWILLLKMNKLNLELGLYLFIICIFSRAVF